MFYKERLKMTKYVSIMQPYFLPYIGYFQQINNVDLYVFYDDVQWIRGWINRHCLLNNNKEYLTTLNVQKHSSHALINEVILKEKSEQLKYLDLIKTLYSKAPYFSNIYKLIEEIIEYKEENLSLFVENSIMQICKLLEIKTKFIRSSDIDYDRTLKGENRIIELCKVLGYKNYVNNINGKDLYRKEDFEKENLNLYFFNRKITPYKQFNNEFVPFLSIIDVLMFNDIETVRNEIVKGELV